MKKILIISFLIPQLAFGMDINMRQGATGGIVSVIGGNGSGGSSSSSVTSTSNVIQFSSTNTVTVENTLTETSLIGAGVGSTTFTAGIFVNGYTFRVKAAGFYNHNTSNYTLRLKLGGTDLGIVTGATNGSGIWTFDSILTIRQIGNAGGIMDQYYFFPKSSGGDTITGPVNITTAAVNTNIDNALDLTVQWDNTDDSISCTNFLIEALAVSTAPANLTIGGTPALEVFSNFDGVSSSPTASIAIGDALKLSISGSTAIINVDFSSVTSRSDVILNQSFLQAGATFYISSGTIDKSLIVGQIGVRPTMKFDASNAGGNAQLNLYNGLTSPGENVFGRDSAGNVDYTFGTNAGSFSMSLSSNGVASAQSRINVNKSSGGTIQLSNDLGVSMAQFLTSSSTLSGQVSLGTVKFPDGTVQVTSPTIPANISFTSITFPDGTVLTSSGTGKADREYFWPASATLPLEANSDAIPPISLINGASNFFDILSTDFDSATNECRGVNFEVPTDVLNSSSATFTVDWMSQTAITGNVGWYFIHDGGVGQGDYVDRLPQSHSSTFDAVQGSTRTLTVTTWTVGITSMTWSAGETVHGNFCRNASNASDTMTGDARAVSFRLKMRRQ